MIATVALASVMAGAVASLLHAIRTGDRTREVLSKITASMSFVFIGFFRWSGGDTIGGWLLAGLALCALGDVLLLGSRSFDSGLSAFLGGHVLYIIGFHTALPVENWSLKAIVPLAIVTIAVTRWLWPYLGRRKPVVTAYLIVISIMAWGGFSTSWGHRLPWTAAFGALLFCLSDLAVARNRFIQPDFVNRAVGLPLYYGGQFLIALTIGS